MSFTPFSPSLRPWPCLKPSSTGSSAAANSPCKLASVCLPSTVITLTSPPEPSGWLSMGTFMSLQDIFPSLKWSGWWDSSSALWGIPVISLSFSTSLDGSSVFQTSSTHRLPSSNYPAFAKFSSIILTRASTSAASETTKIFLLVSS